MSGEVTYTGLFSFVFCVVVILATAGFYSIGISLVDGLPVNRLMKSFFLLGSAYIVIALCSLLAEMAKEARHYDKAKGLD